MVKKILAWLQRLDEKLGIIWRYSIQAETCIICKRYIACDSSIMCGRCYHNVNGKRKQ